jgi:carboxypeptidase C (cathepsin A)
LFFKFPERQSNEIWLSGESYAGIYVPYLAWEIDQYNALGGFTINLKGFIVGNGVTNWKYDTTPAYVEMGFWHGLYDIDLYEQFIKNDCIK